MLNLTQIRGEVMKNTKTKYIFVSGGVISGVGKGIMAASMGAVLKA
jgi:CTP synthase